MSVFKSALNYFNDTSSVQTNEFVGQVVELGNAKMRVKKQIGEGGFAFVYVAQEVTSGKYFALKRLLSSDADVDRIIRQEIGLLKKLSGHPNVIRYLTAAAIDKAQSGHGRNEYLVVTELCTGGNLVDVLRLAGRALPADQVCQIMYQTCKAVQHMHAQEPPVLHRDLKVENLLIGDDGLIKLCDFGSATTTMHYPDPSWSAIQRSLLEDEVRLPADDVGPAATARR
ncbi:cyclin-G-associated kinase-like [Pollicipes pollicipes]|uniref:cyclin-G-associated kinase-like n=1 Tax=Pollicipes pollicipes TaxID=41117 RepID=UPI0018851DE3|nr:cyclin-G-associated kinase-like [Pollicipes pollicipes]